MSIKAAVLLHASVVEPDNSEGRPEWWSSSSYYSIIATRGSVNRSM
ncbi:hypothetical protein [Virgibacillus sp. Bac332]|nr:hypothetical protein [Virgibacillus sp. Bac332]